MVKVHTDFSDSKGTGKTVFKEFALRVLNGIRRVEVDLISEYKWVKRKKPQNMVPMKWVKNMRFLPLPQGQSDFKPKEQPVPHQ